MNSMKQVALASAILLISQFAAAQEQLLCKANAQGGGDIVVSLAAESKFGRVLNCISGDFIADMTPCAPTGGFGLSYPTGAASLSGVVDKRQDYKGHQGGVTGSVVGAFEIRFLGGFNSPDSGFQRDWEFIANRLTGNGTLKLEKRPATKYACTKTKKK